jgi:hypothetical protein
VPLRLFKPDRSFHRVAFPAEKIASVLLTPGNPHRFFRFFIAALKTFPLLIRQKIDVQGLVVPGVMSDNVLQHETTAEAIELNDLGGQGSETGTEDGGIANEARDAAQFNVFDKSYWMFKKNSLARELNRGQITGEYTLPSQLNLMTDVVSISYRLFRHYRDRPVCHFWRAHCYIWLIGVCTGIHIWWGHHHWSHEEPGRDGICATPLRSTDGLSPHLCG